MKPETPSGPSNPEMEAAAAYPSVPERAPPGPAPVVVAPARPAREPDEADRALVERARAGSEEAFAMLVDLHRDRAFGLALRITRSRVDAEDVAQEAFVRAWQALPGFRGESSFGTWLHRIVARRALDRAETLRTRDRRHAELDDSVAIAPGHVTRDPLLAAKLERLMHGLSAAQRAVLTLHYAQDQSVEDVGRSLGLSENTVKTHLARGRAALRAAWVREGGTDA